MLLLLLACARPLAEIPYDGVDQDGDGADLVDVDGDGYPSLLAAGAGGPPPDGAVFDCDDRRPWVPPRAPDAPADGVDADCDGDDPGRVSARTSPTATPR